MFVSFTVTTLERNFCKNSSLVTLFVPKFLNKTVMIHEKIFQLKSGREVKVIVKGFHLHDNPQFSTDCEILIKDPKEKYFRTPIGINHPQYWKMKRSTPQ